MTTTKTPSPVIPHRDSESLLRDVSHLPRTSSALLFHTTDHALAMVTAHGVEHDDAGLPHIGPGRPITPADERRLIDLLMGREQASFEILPHNVLSKGSGYLMWWMQPEVRPMLLKPQGSKKGVEITTCWPSLVLLVVGRTLFVAAVKGNERPHAGSHLFHAPTPNVFADGRVCTGSAKLPLDCELADIDGWQGVLTGSFYTHDNHDDVLVAAKSKRRKKAAADESTRYESNRFWIERDGVVEHFPENRLSPLGLKLGDWPSYLVQGQRNNRQEML